MDRDLLNMFSGLYWIENIEKKKRKTSFNFDSLINKTNIPNNYICGLNGLGNIKAILKR